MQLSGRATSVTGPPYSRLFFVSDAHTNTRFLVDTGSEVSVLTDDVLLAINDTPYGKRSLTLNLGAHYPGFSSSLMFRNQSSVLNILV